MAKLEMLDEKQRHDAGAKVRPFAKIDVEDMRKVLPHINGGAFKVWMAYKLRCNSKGESWMTLKTLAGDTGLEATSVSRHRNSLIRSGGLIPVKDSFRTGNGTFGPPRFRVVIPDNGRMEQLPHGKIAARSNTNLPHGKIGECRTAKLPHQVYESFQVVRTQADGADAPRHFENPKMPDPRFDALRKFYFEEFEKKSPNLKAPFDGGDGKTLQHFLRRQPQATLEELIGWLKNAFASDDVPPLRPQFRLREFCSHAEKYAKGPLKRGGAATRSAPADSAEASRLGELTL